MYVFGSCRQLRRRVMMENLQNNDNNYYYPQQQQTVLMYVSYPRDHSVSVTMFVTKQCKSIHINSKSIYLSFKSK